MASGKSESANLVFSYLFYPSCVYSFFVADERTQKFGWRREYHAQTARTAAAVKALPKTNLYMVLNSPTAGIHVHLSVCILILI